MSVVWSSAEEEVTHRSVITGEAFCHTRHSIQTHFCKHTIPAPDYYILGLWLKAVHLPLQIHPSEERSHSVEQRCDILSFRL